MRQSLLGSGGRFVCADAVSSLCLLVASGLQSFLRSQVPAGTILQIHWWIDRSELHIRQKVRANGQANFTYAAKDGRLS